MGDCKISKASIVKPQITAYEGIKKKVLLLSKVTGRRPDNVTKNQLHVFKCFVKFFSDQGTPLTCCFQRNMSIGFQIKIHFLLIYTKLLKVVGGRGW